MIIITQMQQRRGTAAEWIASNPVLAQGEMGFETDAGNIKIGDGLTHWIDLPYFPQTSNSEWYAPTLTGLSYISATQFSVLGNVTSIFPVGIRVKGNCTAGTIYGTVTECTASGDPVTTYVTVVWDSGSLDSGLSAISVGIFSPVNTSVPTQFFIPTGGYIPYGGSDAPPGFLLCYGQAISRTVYAALFAVIGTGFGAGDGNTTFNVPDFRGRSPIGIDNMGGAAADRVAAATSIGANGGVEEIDLSHVHTTGDHALVVSEMPSHVHDCLGAKYNVSEDNLGSINAVEVGPQSNNGPYPTQSAGGDATHNHGNTESAGSSTQAIMNPYLAGNWIIKS